MLRLQDFNQLFFVLDGEIQAADKEEGGDKEEGEGEEVKSKPKRKSTRKVSTEMSFGKYS